MSRAVLRVKRRRGEDPCDALLISCRPKRARGAGQERRTGGDYEGFAVSASAPPPDVETRVFRLAATATGSSDQAKMVKEIRQTGKVLRPGLVKGGVAPKTGHALAAPPVDPGYNAVLRKRVLGKEAEADVFDVVRKEAKVEDDLDDEFALETQKDEEAIACNDEPLMVERVDESEEGVIFDLYLAAAGLGGKDNDLNLSFLDNYLDVKPYSGDSLDALENYGVVEPASMLERGFLGVEDEDSNDEDNWRNDYPDSDPEEKFNQEERDYDECGFIRDEDEEDAPHDDVASPAGQRDTHLAELLRSRMKLRGNILYQGDEDVEDDSGNSDSRESDAYVAYKKRTLASFASRSRRRRNDDDDDDEEEDVLADGDEEVYNDVAYDDEFDGGSAGGSGSDSFDFYDG